MNQVTEAELKAHATAPRISQEDLDANIKSIGYINAGQAIAYAERRDWIGDRAGPDLLTICVITLQNGFTVLGESACASPENFNEEIGQRLALADAKGKIWCLMGYELRQRLHEAGAAT